MNVVIALGLLVALATASYVDLRERRLPDALTLPLVVAGLAVTFMREGVAALGIHLLAALAAAAVFWAVARLYRATRGIDGLGLGDAKLMASAGAWLGPWLLAPLVFAGAILALLYVGFLRLRGEPVSSKLAVPFGPFLSAAFLALWCLRELGWVPY